MERRFLLLIFLMTWPLMAQSDISTESIQNSYSFLDKDAQVNTLLELLFKFDTDENARSLFKELLPKDDSEVHLSLCKACYERKQQHLIEVIFALIPNDYKNAALEAIKNTGYQYIIPRPGTLGSNEVYTMKLDNAEVYFFMDLEKYELAKKMVENTSRMCHSICAGEFPLTTIEVSPACTIFEEPIGYTRDLQPIYFDFEGRNAIEDYTHKVAAKIKNLLDLNMLCVSRQMSLVVSHDAMRFHRDQLPIQYEFLNKKGCSFPKCWLAQDLTLMDWDMSEGTLSGTLMEESSSKDRFYFFLQPGEVTTNLTLDPPLYPEDGSPPVYPGAKTLPFHSATAPVDLYGGKSAGSSKGKRISNVVRGVVLDDEVQALRKRAIPLSLNQAKVSHTDDKGILFQYPSGMSRKDFPNPIAISVEIDSLLRMPPSEEVEILRGEVLNQENLLNGLGKLLCMNFDGHSLDYYKLIKRSTGFSNIDSLGINIPENSFVVMRNLSQLPINYEYYPLTDKFSNSLPWIQFYQLGPNSLLICDGKNIQQLGLTPLEEIFFRNAVWDADSEEVPLLSNNFSTHLELFVINPPQESSR